MSQEDLIARVGAGLARAVFTASDLVFGPWTVVLLFGTGIFLTLALPAGAARPLARGAGGDAPRARPRAGARSARSRPSRRRSPRRSAPATSPGVATAIVSGGPGALFWIWCYGFFATAIKFTEAVLGVRFRVARRRAARPRARCTTCATAWGCRGSAGCTRSSRASRRSRPRPSPSPTRSRSCCSSELGVPTLGRGHRGRGPDLAGDHRRRHARSAGPRSGCRR